MARDVCNELRSGLMLVVQASAKEQIKAFDSPGAKCVLMNHTLSRKVGGFALHLRGFALDNSSCDPKSPGNLLEATRVLSDLALSKQSST
jgi:hypothetical protein